MQNNDAWFSCIFNSLIEEKVIKLSYDKFYYTHRLKMVYILRNKPFLESLIFFVFLKSLYKIKIDDAEIHLY